MKKTFLGVAALFAVHLLQAQQPADSINTVLDEVVVTANKTSQKQTETGKVLTVITRQDLEKNSGRSVGDILNTIAGTTIIGSGNAYGTNLTASIRGASAGNVLILIDGTPANDPSVITNYFDLNFIDPSQIERIEVLKGGQSTLYGSDAVAGVINIITRKAGAKKFGLNTHIGGGTFSTFKAGIGINGRSGGTDYVFNYNRHYTDGLSAATDKNSVGNFDRDGFKQDAFNARLGFTLTKNLKANISGLYSNYNGGLDASGFTDDRDFTVETNNKQAGAGLTYTLKKGSFHFNYNYNRSERIYVDDSLHKGSSFINYAKSRYTGGTHFADFYTRWQLNKIELLAGVDYRSNNTFQTYWSIGPFGPYAPPALTAENSQVSPYVSMQFKLENGFNIETGARINFHSEYGNNVSFTLNPSYFIPKKLKLFANLYSAYKVPTLFQLFDISTGNINLQPENSLVSEAGIELLSVKNLKGRITGFFRSAKDAIVYTFNPTTFAGKYINAAKQTNYGFEAEAWYTKDKWKITANYTYTNGKTTSAYNGTGAPINKDTSYFNLYRIPKHSINASIGYQFTKDFYMEAQMRSFSKREEFIYGSNPEVLKAYAVVNVYAEYKFGKDLKWYLDLRNLSDNRYVEILGYNARNFNFITGFHFKL